MNRSVDSIIAADLSPTRDGPIPLPNPHHVSEDGALLIPAELRAISRWVVWRWVSRSGKWTKPPINPATGLPSDATDRDTWMTFEEARDKAAEHGDGIGFAFGPDGPYCGIDLDRVLSEDGEVEPWALAIIDRLPGAYVEITPSRTGLHIILRGCLPRDEGGKSKHRTKDWPGIEFYDAGRYFTFTGNPYRKHDGPIADLTAEVATIHAEVFTPKPKSNPLIVKASAPAAATGDTDDDRLRKAMESGNGAAFSALWAGNTTGHGGDDSAADLALCNYLAFWFGPDPGRVDAMFRRSGLMRDKWDSKRPGGTYGSETIAKALDGRTEFYETRGGSVSPRVFPPADDGWGPIRLGSLPPAEPFPLDVLPIPARDLAEAAARSIGCPVDFPAVATLAAASGLIGRSASLLVKPGYFASASLYVALVGGPSSGKSPALKAAMKPMWDLSHGLHADWRKAMDDWKQIPKDERNGEGPILKRIVTSDPTTEALGPILADNPRGLTVAPDEMTKWVMSMDQYKGGKGGDRPFYLSTWNGDSVVIDRAKHAREPIVAPFPFLTVAGGMTPDMLPTLHEGGGRDDGFLARLLFAYPDRTPRIYTEEGIPDAVADAWNDLALALWQRPMRDEGAGAVPHVAKMDHEARREWKAWCEAHYAEQEAEDFPDSLEGPWGKMEAYMARLALILHLMHLAADPTAPAHDDPPDLPRRIIRDAARLVACFKSHARRVRAAMGGKIISGGDDVLALRRWIGRSRVVTFSERDARHNLPRFKDDEAGLSDALAIMVKLGYIRPHDETASRPGPGRKPTRRYDVNPRLLESAA